MKEAIIMNNNTNNTTAIEVKRVDLPTNFADFKIKTLKELGLESMKKPVNAKADLINAGVSAKIEFTDAESVIIDAVSTSVDKAESAIRNVGLGLGIISYYRVWEKAKNPDGKVYGNRGKMEYLKDRFPDKDPKTMINYLKTGEKVSLAIAAQSADMDGLDKLADLPLTTAAKALPLLESDKGKEALRKMIKEDKPLTSRTIAALAREVKDADKDKDGENDDKDNKEANDTTPQINKDDFKGKAAEDKFSQNANIYFDESGGTIQIALYKRDIMQEWFEQAMADGAMAMELCKIIYKGIKNAK